MLHHRVIFLVLYPDCRLKLISERDMRIPFPLIETARTPQSHLTPAQALPAVSESAWNAGTAHSRAASQAAVARRGETGFAAAAPPPVDRDGPPLVPTQSVRGLPPALGGRRHGAFHGPQLSITDVSSRVNAGNADAGGLTPELPHAYPPAPPAGQPVQQQQQQHLLAGRYPAQSSRKNSDDARWEVPPSGTHKQSSKIKSGVTALACLIAGWFVIGRMYVRGRVRQSRRSGIADISFLLGTVMRGEVFPTSDVTLCISPDDCSST